MGHGGMHSGVSECVKLGSGRGCVGGLGRGGGGGHGGVRLCGIWYEGVWGCLMGGWVCVWAWGGKMGGVGREGVSVGGMSAGGGTGYLPWCWQDLSGSGCVWVLLPTSGWCQVAAWGWVVLVWGGMQVVGVWWSSMVISFE